MHYIEVSHACHRCSPENKNILPGQEQIAYTGTTPVKSRTRSKPLHNFKIDDIKEAPDQFLLGQRNTCPELMRGFDYVEPFRSCRCVVFRQTMIEELLDGLCLHACVWDQSHEPRSYVSDTCTTWNQILCLRSQIQNSPGPPKTRISSLDDPPLSLIGMT